MSGCPAEDRFDDYLFDRMEEKEKEAFEAHYFDCPACFDRLKERDEIRHVIRSGAAFPPGTEPVFEKEEKAGFVRRPLSLFVRRPWVWAGAAAMMLAGVLILMPRGRGPVSEFVLVDGETLRGAAMSLVSPLGDVPAAPAAFEWRAVRGEVEYQVSLSGAEPLWKETTRDTRLVLPDDIKSRLSAGVAYTWQVKAFSREGTLVAASAKAAFTIQR